MTGIHSGAWTVFPNCLGLAPAKVMVEDQGIDTLDEVHFLKDHNVETLCKSVKCPGGAALGNKRSANLGHLVSLNALFLI